MRKLIVFLLFACCAMFGQQTNSDIIPATSGLNLGHSNQRWNGYFTNLDINGTCTVNGLPCLGGGGSGSGITITTVVGLATVPGKINGTIAVVTNGLTSSDCTVGGGTTNVACQFNGTAWSQLTAGGAQAWNSILNPTGNAALSMGTTTTLLTFGDFGVSPSSGIYTSTDSATTTTDTSTNVVFDSGPSSRHTSIALRSQGVNQLQVCWQAGPLGEVVLGSTVTCPTISQSPFARFVAMSGTPAHTVQRLYQKSTVATGTMLEMNNATASSSAYKFFTACSGASATDTSCTGGSIVASLGGNGLFTAASLAATNMTGGPFCVHETAGVLTATAADCGSGGGGGLSGQSVLGFPIAATATTSTSSTVPGTNQGTYLVGRANTVQGTATTPTEIQVGDCTSAGTISGATTTYTVVYSDVIGCNVVHDRLASASATITLPVPATLNNPAPIVIYSNYSAFNDTVTPTTYTISAGTVAAAATLTVNSGFACKIQLDPVNASTWKADCHQMATTGAGGGTTTNALTMNNGNSGAASGSTFNGSAAVTISTNSIGAANLGTANAFSTGLQDMSAADYLQPKHATDPATCTEGQLEENTTSHVVKFCSALNTWTALAGGTIDANNGSAGSLAMYVAAGGSTTIDPDASLIDATNTLTYSGTSGITASAGPLSSGTNGGTGGTLALRGSTSSTVTFSVAPSGSVWGTNQAPQMGDTQNYGFSQTTSGTGGSGGARLSVIGTGATEAMDVTAGTSTKLLNMGNACSFASAITVTTNTTICSWTLPNVAHQWQWSCNLYFNLTTLGTSPTLSLNMNASVAPTSENGNAVIYTTNTGTFTEANNVAFTTAGNNLILTSAAYAGTGTYRAHTSGTIQASATSGAFAITATLGGTAPAGNMAVSSSCRIF